jgi:Tetratricopeptide repeat
MFQSESCRPARHDLGLAHVRLAKIQQVLADYREAETMLDKAIALLAALNRAQPDVAYQRDLAAGFAALGDIYRETSRFDKAEAAYQQALAIQEKLAAAHSDVAAYPSALANIYFWPGDHAARIASQSSERPTTYAGGTNRARMEKVQAVIVEGPTSPHSLLLVRALLLVEGPTSPHSLLLVRALLLVERKT